MRGAAAHGERLEPLRAQDPREVAGHPLQALIARAAWAPSI
ncbi:hypothetical protein ACIBUY_19530 [Streptomyces sp. NPDC050085]